MKTRTAWVALASMTLLAAVVSTAPGASAATHVTVHGSGSTWAANAMTGWITGAKPGAHATFLADGSPQGRKDFASATKDFAVTDVPYQGTDPVTHAPDNSNGRAYGDVPLLAGATTFPYHLKINGVLYRTLRLSGPTIAKIFMNQITNWDDPAITADNNGVQLPSIAIIPVVHHEQSGVSLEVSTYLATQFPAFWLAFSGSAAPTPYYPREGNAHAGADSDAVFSFIRSAQGSIGMDEYAVALAAHYPVAKVENDAQFFTLPTADNVAIALEATTIETDPSSPDYMRPDLQAVFDATDPRAYIFSSYSSELLPTSAGDPVDTTTAQRQVLADFTAYAICQGQNNLDLLGYAPLPLNLVKAAMVQIYRLHDADPGVDVSNIGVSKCANPTFDPADPTSGLLDSTAPQPQACDAFLQGPCGAPPVTRLASTVTLAKTRTKVRFGHIVTLHGTLAGPQGAPLTGSVELQRRPGPKQKWIDLRPLTTTMAGDVQALISPVTNSEYRFKHYRDHRSLASMSVSRHVVVRAAVTAHFKSATIRAGGRATVVGHVDPDPAYRVQLQRRRGKVWQTIDAKQLRTRTFRLHAYPTQLGVAKFRVRIKATPFNGSGTTAPLTLRIKPTRAH